MPDDSIIIDTPEGIAFFRALARQGAAREGRSGIISILKKVYGYTGSPKAVRAMHDDYIEGTLTVRHWSPEYGKYIRAIAQEAINRAEEEHGADPNLKAYADSNVQMLFDIGAITEQEGNDACLFIFVEVVRLHALAVEPGKRTTPDCDGLPSPEQTQAQQEAQA